MKTIKDKQMDNVFFNKGYTQCKEDVLGLIDELKMDGNIPAEVLKARITG